MKSLIIDKSITNNVTWQLFTFFLKKKVKILRSSSFSNVAFILDPFLFDSKNKYLWTFDRWWFDHFYYPKLHFAPFPNPIKNISIIDKNRNSTRTLTSAQDRPSAPGQQASAGSAFCPPTATHQHTSMCPNISQHPAVMYIQDVSNNWSLPRSIMFSQRL